MAANRPKGIANLPPALRKNAEALKAGKKLPPAQQKSTKKKG